MTSAWPLVALVLLITGAIVVALRREPDRFIRWTIVLGLGAKGIGTVARYVVLTDVYGGIGDATRYLYTGTDIAAQLTSGTLPPGASNPGTPFMEFLAGVFYVVAPGNLVVGFGFFSMLSFVGAWLFLQAFRVALPHGDHRRYAVLIMFLPTMLFWPSSLGKESWLVFTLGLAAYGGARVLQRRRAGYVLLALGGAGAYMVRPHMAALFAVGFVIAYVLRRRDPTVQRSGVAWTAGLFLIAAVSAFVLSTFAEQLPRDRSVDGSALEQVLAETQDRTSSGGSEFDSTPVTSPVDLVDAVITVPFRPFPHEAHNAQAALASFEGTLLLLVVLASLGRLRQVPSQVLRHPWVALAFVYVGGFIVAFSNVGNFGLLARQRAQLIPMLLVLLCLQRRHERATEPTPMVVPAPAYVATRSSTSS